MDGDRFRKLGPTGTGPLARPAKGGLANSGVIDLITYDPRTDEVVLVMFEDREWGRHGERLADLKAKVETYVTYFREDRIAKEYPAMAGKLIRFQLLCRESLGELEKGFIAQLRKETLAPLELRLTVTVAEERLGSGAGR